MFQIFFYFAEILKMTELRPKNRFFGPEIPKDSKKAKTEEDSYSGICQQKLLTKAMFKPLGYDVHNVHISVYSYGQKSCRVKCLDAIYAHPLWKAISPELLGLQ